VRCFAVQEPFEPISRGFRERSGTEDALVLTLLLAVAAAVVVALLLALLGKERDPARRLFRRLADANGLTGAERRLLRRVAERAAAENWALLFFRRSLFEESAAGLDADAREVDRVRRKLYAP
jgi:hypothetical protein